MEFKQLESFLAVVKFRSFTKAAEKLYSSQPTISTHIRNLEEELQTQLIIRTTKNIEITPRGKELYECASKMLQLRDNLLKSWMTDDRKQIHLGASTIPSGYILPEILPEFGKICPDVYFEVDQSDSQGIVDALLRGEFDVGLIGMPCDEDSLVCLPFYRDRMVVITPVTERFLKQDGRLDADIISESPFILREEGSGSRKSAANLLEQMGIEEEKLHVVARINDQESIKNLVAGGLGISIISERAVRNFVKEKRLLAFDIPTKAAERNLYLVFHKNYRLTPYMEEFIRFVRKYYPVRDEE